jgi:hypothetical protein
MIYGPPQWVVSSTFPRDSVDFLYLDVAIILRERILIYWRRGLPLSRRSRAPRSSWAACTRAKRDGVE